MVSLYKFHILRNGDVEFSFSLWEQRRERLDIIIFLPDLCPKFPYLRNGHIVVHGGGNWRFPVRPVKQDGFFIIRKAGVKQEIVEDNPVPAYIVHSVILSVREVLQRWSEG